MGEEARSEVILDFLTAKESQRERELLQELISEAVYSASSSLTSQGHGQRVRARSDLGQSAALLSTSFMRGLPQSRLFFCTLQIQ